MSKLAGIIFFILSLVTFCAAQFPTVAFTSGNGSRNGYSHVPGGSIPGGTVVFRFRFLNTNSDVNGGVYANATTNPSEIVTSCCFYGKRFSLNDQTGSENFMQKLDEPVVVNGTTYNEFYYKGYLRFQGSGLVPFYLKKKLSQTIKFPITVTGVIRGYATLADRNSNTNAVFITPIDMKGTAKVTVRRHDEYFQENHFDIVSVEYDIAP